jgi:hypothetical protein
MFKFLEFLRNVTLLNKRLTAEEVRQKAEGYKIEFTQKDLKGVLLTTKKTEVYQWAMSLLGLMT